MSTRDYINEPLPLRFPAPRTALATRANSFEYWWGLLQHATPVDDPTTFRPLAAPLDRPDERTLQRYVETTCVLARSAQLNGEDRVTSHWSREHGSRLEVDFAAPDATSGFLAYFRQVYAPEEPASFARALGILMRAVKQSKDEDHRAEQERELRTWGRAAGQLRGKNLRRACLDLLVARGLLSEDDPAYAGVPEQLLSEYMYGEHLHWARHAERLEERKNSAFLDAWMRLAFLEAAIPLAHLYIGFGVLVETALAGVPGAAGT